MKAADFMVSQHYNEKQAIFYWFLSKMDYNILYRQLVFLHFYHESKFKCKYKKWPKQNLPWSECSFSTPACNISDIM